jgi:hypothetical protein
MVAIALGEIALVGLITIALTTWPLWRRYRKLKQENDAKALEIFERWQPLDRRDPS